MGLKMTHIPRKIKFLRNYKVYSIDIFKNEEKDLARKYLNKSAKEGEIIKISKEKFYKRALKDRNKPAPKITNHPKDKEALRKNELCTYRYCCLNTVFGATLAFYTLNQLYSCANG